MTILHEVLSLFMLSAFIWAVGFVLPKALREHNRFGAICSVLTAAIALLGWLLIGAPVHSR